MSAPKMQPTRSRRLAPAVGLVMALAIGLTSLSHAQTASASAGPTQTSSLNSVTVKATPQVIGLDNARWEFAVVLESSTAEQARQVGERIRQEVGKLVVETEKGPLKVTMSVGISSFPEDARERAVLIERADLALYHAKHSGRNQVVTHAQFVAARSKKAS